MASRSLKRSPMTSSASAAASRSEGMAEGGCCPSASITEHPLGRRLLGEDLGEARANRFALAAVEREAQEPGFRARAKGARACKAVSAGEPSSTMRSRADVAQRLAARAPTRARRRMWASGRQRIHGARATPEAGCLLGGEAELTGQGMDGKRTPLPEGDAGKCVEREVGAERAPGEGNCEYVCPGQCGGVLGRRRRARRSGRL